MAPTNDGGDDERATAASDDDNLRELFTKKLLHRTGAARLRVEALSWNRISPAIRFASRVPFIFSLSLSPSLCSRLTDMAREPQCINKF